MSKKGTVCAVAECSTSSQINKEFSFHRFPVDDKLRKQWIIKTLREDEFNPNTSRVCSRHFNKDDFKRDFKAELLGLSPKSLLKPGVVPSLHLRFKENLSSSSSLRSERYAKKKRQEENRAYIEEALKDAPSTSSIILDVRRLDEETSATDVAEHHDTSQPCLKDEGTQVEDVYVNQILQENAELKKEIEKLRDDLRRVENTEKEHLALLNTVFSKNEIEILLKKKKVVRWTKDEIGSAITLKYLSKRANVHLRQKRGFPVPGLSTLKR